VFKKTMSVRKLSPDAEHLADRYLFETPVRLHRAGEGEPFTGLKPAGRDLGPVIPAVDRAVATGSAEALVKLFTEAARPEVTALFGEVLARKNYNPGDVGAGGAYVRAYVDLMHRAEHLSGPASEQAAGKQGTGFGIPRSLQHEHADLHEGMERAVRAGGETGEEARAVEKLFRPHFVKEEEYALPPLGTLRYPAGSGGSPGRAACSP
jgi:hypothetical protein